MTDAPTLTLTAFLLDRIAEDEQQFDLPEFVEDHDSARSPGWGSRGDCPMCCAYMPSGSEPSTEDDWWEHVDRVHQRARVLAECKAKRSVIEVYKAQWSKGKVGDYFPSDHLRAMAEVYADHPDFREEWRA